MAKHVEANWVLDTGYRNILVTKIDVNFFSQLQAIREFSTVIMRFLRKTWDYER